jgi:hypothetical protein
MPVRVTAIVSKPQAGRDADLAPRPTSAQSLNTRTRPVAAVRLTGHSTAHRPDFSTRARRRSAESKQQRLRRPSRPERGHRCPLLAPLTPLREKQRGIERAAEGDLRRGFDNRGRQAPAQFIRMSLGVGVPVVHGPRSGCGACRARRRLFHFDASNPDEVRTSPVDSPAALSRRGSRAARRPA